jgi:hypothetical protein
MNTPSCRRLPLDRAAGALLSEWQRMLSADDMGRPLAAMRAARTVSPVGAAGRKRGWSHRWNHEKLLDEESGVRA